MNSILISANITTTDHHLLFLQHTYHQFFYAYLFDKVTKSSSISFNKELLSSLRVNLALKWVCFLDICWNFYFNFVSCINGNKWSKMIINTSFVLTFSRRHSLKSLIIVKVRYLEILCNRIQCLIHQKLSSFFSFILFSVSKRKRLNAFSATNYSGRRCKTAFVSLNIYLKEHHLWCIA